MSLLDEAIRACTQCGLCIAACPTAAFDAHEAANPRGRVQAIALTSKPGLGAVPPEVGRALWSCISCGACTTVCPTGVDVGGMMAQARGTVSRALEGEHAVPLVERMAALRGVLSRAGLDDAGIERKIVATIDHFETRAPAPARDGASGTVVVASILAGDDFVASASRILDRSQLDSRVVRTAATGVLEDAGEYAGHAAAVDDLREWIGAARRVVAIDEEAVRLQGVLGTEYELVSLAEHLEQSAVWRASDVVPRTENILWDGQDNDRWAGPLRRLLSLELTPLPARLLPATVPPILTESTVLAHARLTTRKSEWVGAKRLVTAQPLSLERFDYSMSYTDLFEEAIGIS